METHRIKALGQYTNHTSVTPIIATAAESPSICTEWDVVADGET